MKAEQKEKICHNCGKCGYGESWEEGVWAAVNKYLFWFHNKACFDEWNENYKDKYKGGLV